MKHDTLFTLSAYFDFLADHRIVNVLHQYLRSSADVTAGEDGLDNTRPLDQLVAVVKEIFQDRCTMIKFLFGEFRRWQGRQFLNQVLVGRTCRVKWMPETSDSALRQPLQTFFHTVEATSLSSTEPNPRPSVINVFKPCLDNTVEALMRLAVAGAAPLNTDVEDFGTI